MMAWKFEYSSRVKVIVVWISIFLTNVNSYRGWNYTDLNEILEVGDRCNLTNGEIGICRFIPDCKVYYDGLQSKTIEYSTLKRCSLIGFEEIICCPTEGFDFRRTKEGDIPITVDTTQPTERPSEAACRNYSNTNPGKIIYHIMGGTPVGLGEFPHMGAVLLSNDPVPVLRCGSSLISEEYVLTAAHCFNDRLNQAQVIRFGSVRLNSTDIPPVDAVIDKVHLHPQYRYPSSYHDIALVKLKTPITLSPFVRPACLHNNVADIDSLIQLFVTGWGVTNITTKTLSDVLLKTNVTWLSTPKCVQIYEKEILTRKYKNGLTHGQACAYDPQLKNDACWSDSGGPLQMVVNNISTIVGIVSFGKVCATTTPAVYTRVASYLNWIECMVWPTAEQKRIGNCSNVI